MQNPVAAKRVEIFARLLISMLISGSVSGEQWLVRLAGFSLIRVFKKVALRKIVLRKIVLGKNNLGGVR
jgi:hypothetical protein